MSHARSIVERLTGLPVLVIGDVMLDHFVVGRVDRISPEAPVPIVRLEREEYRLGGAANVTHNIRSLGGHGRLVGVVGDDSAAVELRRQLEILEIDADGLIVDPTRPTTRKTRIVTVRNQQVARVDQEEDAEASGPALDALRQRLEGVAASARALVLSDYRKGVVSPAVIAAASAAAAAADVPLLIDPKTPNATRYRGASLITPNHHEAELMTQTSIRSSDEARTAARLLHEQTGANILITRGEYGMCLLDARGPKTVERDLPAVSREVADVTGAGDTVIAVLALALAAGAPLSDAARLANAAAGLVVARFGPATISQAELAAGLDG